MKTSRNIVTLAILAAVCFASAAAQAVGFDIAGFVAARPDLAIGLASLASMGMVGEITLNPDDIKLALKKIGDDVKEEGTKAFKEIEKLGVLTKEQKEIVDKLLVKQGELQTQVTALEQKADRSAKQEEEQKSTGEALVACEEFKEWIAKGGMKSTSSGFVFPVKAITSLSNSAGQGVETDRRPGIVTPPERRMTVRDLITPGRTESNMVAYVKETGWTNNAATVSETVQKPESNITYGLTQSAVVTIAHWIKAAKQILDDFKGLSSNIDGRLRYGLRFVEEAQLLKGSGSGNNLNGIYTQATAYSAPITLPGTLTKIDVIRLMLLQAELAEYPSTGIVMHPSDWTAIELTKETTGGYIFANPQSLAAPALWGRPVVPTQAMTVDTALVGAFRLGAQVFDREDANVVISTENQDDFIKNMVTIRGEERLAMAVYRPEAFVKNTNLPAD